MTAAAFEPERAPARAGTRSYFYVWLSLACVAVAFLGFAPTYFYPLAKGAFKANPIVHIHGIVFFSWTLFGVYQAWLVAQGKTANHREVGLIGISLASIMFVLGFLAAINSSKAPFPPEMRTAGLEFLILPIFGILMFGALVAIGIANVRKPETHKRMMMLATISILDAPVARWFLVAFADPNAPPAPPPVFVGIPPALIADLLIVAAIVYDWRKVGKPHPVWLWGGAAVVIEEVARWPVSATPMWHAIANWIVGITG